jgi:quercetin dioxygenase-like cupin family protein
MTPEEFTAELGRAGFEQFVEIEWPANGSLDEHSHPFESRALILSGEIILDVEGRETRYGVGEVFHLPHGTPHKERYGPSGVRYLVGRK